MSKSSDNNIIDEYNALKDLMRNGGNREESFIYGTYSKQELAINFKDKNSLFFRDDTNELIFEQDFENLLKRLRIPYINKTHYLQINSEDKNFQNSLNSLKILCILYEKHKNEPEVTKAITTDIDNMEKQESEKYELSTSYMEEFAREYFELIKNNNFKIPKSGKKVSKQTLDELFRDPIDDIFTKLESQEKFNISKFSTKEYERLQTCCRATAETFSKNYSKLPMKKRMSAVLAAGSFTLFVGCLGAGMFFLATGALAIGLPVFLSVFISLGAGAINKSKHTDIKNIIKGAGSRYVLPQYTKDNFYATNTPKNILHKQNQNLSKQ